MLTIGEITADFDEREAYIRDLTFEITELKSLIYDGLTRKADLWLKTELLQSVGVIESKLRKALAQTVE